MLLPSLERLEDRTVPSFLPHVEYPVGGKPLEVLVGDFNADGIPDFATLDYLNYLDGSLSIRLGVGDGSFSEAPTIHLDDPVRFSHAADLNLDGCTDLLHTNEHSSALSIHLSNCDGTFAPRQDHRTSGYHGLTVADFDLDGLPDVALTRDNLRNSTVSMLFGQADGTFRASGSYTVGRDGWVIFSADLNGDGVHDLVSSSGYLLLNQGDGTFVQGQILPDRVEALAAADWNGDGTVDLAVGSREGVGLVIYLGNGDGTFTRGDSYLTRYIVLGVVASDFDLNGTTDLAFTLIPDGVRVLLNHGDGTFQEPKDFATAGIPVAVATADLNLDGYGDLIVANYYEGRASVLLNDGDWPPDPAPRGDDAGREASRRLVQDRDVLGMEALLAILLDVSRKRT